VKEKGHLPREKAGFFIGKKRGKAIGKYQFHVKRINNLLFMRIYKEEQ